MKISERITGTIENWRTLWGEAFKGFLTTVISFGLEVFMDVLGKAFAPKLTPLVDMLEKSGVVSPELQPLLDEIKNPKGEIGALLSQSAGGAVVSGGLSRILDILFLPVSYALNEGTPVRMPDEGQLTALWLRDKITDENFEKYLKELGDNPLARLAFRELSQGRIDPGSWITAFRRKYKNFAQIENDLRDQGWSPARIEALKFVTLYYPSPAELIHWTAREVFEPDMVSKYGLTADMDKLRREDFYKAGMDDEQINNHWIAHWEHASWMQMIEMLHRGIITEQDVKDWFPLIEMAPYWAENLIKIAYTWPTRVDVRRFWDMRTIDEARLRELYEGMGYHDKNLEDYIKWTKVYTDFPMMMTRFKSGWITEDEIRSWLIGLGIPPERVEQFIQEKTKPEAPARVENERDLTKAEIVKGVKKGVITWAQGSELLQDLGYSKEEAEFKLTIDVGALEGSPETYPEFKQITQLYRKAEGLKAMEVPQEIIEASKGVAEAKAVLNQVLTGERTDITEIQARTKLSDAEYRYRQLLIKWEATKPK